jgi:hypothetical protein
VLVLAMSFVGALGPTALSAQVTGGSFGGSDDDWGSGGGSSWGSTRDHGGGIDEGFGASPAHEWPREEPRTWPRDHTASSDDWASPAPSGPDLWALARIERGRPDVLEAERAALQPTIDDGDVLSGAWLSLFSLAVVLGLGTIWGPRRAAVDAPFHPDPGRFAALLAQRAQGTGARPTLTRLSVGYGPEARALLQRGLVEIAQGGEARSRAGRHGAARRVADLMRAHAASARYAMLSSDPVRGAEGPAALARTSQDLRARFRVDTVGRVRSAAPEGLAARPEDGPGLVVVSLVLGARSGGPPSHALRTTNDVAHVLDTMIPHAEDLVGLEVVWSPSEEADRLSSYELEALYPELARLDDARDVGAMRCEACGGGFSRELRACPHCGKPVSP